MAITGSGIAAIEFAKVFEKLRSEVTLIIRDKIPRNALMKIGFDKDISATLVADLVSESLFRWLQKISMIAVILTNIKSYQL